MNFIFLFLTKYKRISFIALPLWVQFFWIFIAITTFLSFLIFIKRPFSIKNGANFINEYNKISKIKTKGTTARFFSFQFWPIDKQKRQIIPHSIANYNNFFFLVDSFFWAESARWKIKNKNLIVNLFFLIKITILAMVFLAFAFFIVWFTSFSQLKAINPLVEDIHFHLPAVGFFLIVFLLTFIPRQYMINVSLKIVNKMNISEKDKKYFHKLINWFWLFPLVFAFLESILFILEFLAWNKTRLKLIKEKN